MSLPEPVSNQDPNQNPEITAIPDASHLNEVNAQEERKRRSLLLVLLGLLLILCVALSFTVRYFLKPGPITEMLPGVIAKSINYPPTFKFSISGVNRPIGVAVSADSQRVYITEGAGDRMIKMFDRDGRLVQSFAPPGTTSSNRQPSYIAVHQDGRVFVTDNYNHTINVFDPSGNFIDSILDVNVTLSKLVAAHNQGSVPQGTLFFYDNVSKKVYFQLPDQDMQSISMPEKPWGPLGLHFNAQGDLYVTDINNEHTRIVIFPADSLSGSWVNFAPQVKIFGTVGTGDGQLAFPNAVAVDSQNNIYVSDGNNGRISLWNANLTYRTFFGYGTDATSFNLPRGMWIDSKDRLHVADAVGHQIRVFDVSGADPAFLFNFGEFGINDGEFNFPTDICIDGTGRLYITDRENNRIQIWSY